MVYSFGVTSVNLPTAQRAAIGQVTFRGLQNAQPMAMFACSCDLHYQGKALLGTLGEGVDLITKVINGNTLLRTCDHSPVTVFF